MFRHDYPYTDFHELNLDWFLAKFRALLAEWDAMQIKFDDLDAAVKALKNYVENYFSNLDVQEEINNYFDELLSDGRIYNLIYESLNGSLISEANYEAFANVIPTGDNFYSQGFAVGVIDNRPVCLNCFTDDSTSGSNNEIIFTYMDTGLEIGRHIIGSGHCNSATFNNDTNTFFITCGGGGSSDERILELNVDGSIRRTYNMGAVVWAITYNRGNFFCMVDSILRKYDSTLTTYEEINVNLTNEYTHQGLFSDDLYLFFPVGNPITSSANVTKRNNLIAVYTHEGDFIKYILCKYPLEIEEGDIYNGVLYLNSNTQNRSVIFTNDLYYKNPVLNSIGNLTRTDNTNVSYNCYINETYTGFFMDGSQSKPFTSLNFWALFIPNYVSVVNVNLLSDCPTHVFSWYNNNVAIVNLNGNNHKILRITVVNDGEVQLRNITVLCENNKDGINIRADRLYATGLKIGDIDSDITPSRGIYLKCDYEIASITFNIAPTTNTFYFIGNGIVNTWTMNISNIAAPNMIGAVSVGESYPYLLINNARSSHHCTYKPQFHMKNNFDVTSIFHPCVMDITAGQLTITNAPEGFDGSVCVGVVVERISETKSLVTMCNNTGGITSFYNNR